MRKLLVILVAWLVPAIQAGTRRAYLPVTGPVPLRFEQTRPPGVTNLVLPPLDLGKFAEEPPLASHTNALAAATNQPPKAVASAAAPPAVPATLPPAASPSPTNAPTATPVAVLTAAPPPLEPPNPDVMSAQKLVQFFKFSAPAANSNNTAVVVPVQFAPPPVSPPGSSATYRSP